MGKLDGKVVIVTGATRGLGRAYAKRLPGLGAKVAVADLNPRFYEEFELRWHRCPVRHCRRCPDATLILHIAAALMPAGP
jgi:NAD(P)-dependent dehydrogenase (short-subunit alcohol dehydrogenase family)